MMLTISIFPKDLQFAPSQEAVKATQQLMQQFFPYPRDYEVEVKQYPKPRFFTAGLNCESYTCPACSTKTEVDYDDDESWRGFIEAAEEAPDATTHSVTMPCCKNAVLLPTIKFGRCIFGETATIARFMIGLADVESALPDEKLAEIEKALGCKAIQWLGAGT